MDPRSTTSELLTQAKATRFIADVYLRMVLALLTSAAIGYCALQSGLLYAGWQTLGRGFSLGIFATQLITVFAFQNSVYNLKPARAQMLFAFYAAITGLTFATIGALYTLDSILTVALVSTGAFASLAFYGKVTQRDLGPLGSFALAGLSMLLIYSLGVWVASFIPFLSVFMGTAITVQALVGTVLFAAMIAYESQKLRNIAYELAQTGADEKEMEVLINSAALGMYMNFVGLFLSLMRLLGRRR